MDHGYQNTGRTHFGTTPQQLVTHSFCDRASPVSPVTNFGSYTSFVQHIKDDSNMNSLQRKAQVKLNAMPWFHGKISREMAEDLLTPKENGLFLVRESTNYPGDYTLCVCYVGKVEHYRVKYKDNQLTIDDEEFFENLSQLVEHYQKDADGLCTQLTKSLPKKGKQEFCIDTKSFIDAGWVIQEQELQVW
uniref:Tyrosine-protein kinase CSK n=1 Tax=Schizaphis graminum TaxID=13262 RepID=A0A2S2PMB6_SCHGA